MIQHVSTQSLHSYTTEMAHLDTLKPIHTAAKKLKRLCRCLPDANMWRTLENEINKISYKIPTYQSVAKHSASKICGILMSFVDVCGSNWVELGRTRMSHLTDGCSAKCCQGSDVDAIHCSRIKCTNRSILGSESQRIATANGFWYKALVRTGSTKPQYPHR